MLSGVKHLGSGKRLFAERRDASPCGISMTHVPRLTVDMRLHALGRDAAERLLRMVDGEGDSGVVRLPCSLVAPGSA
jgi:hypothetical protein